MHAPVPYVTRLWTINAGIENSAKNRARNGAEEAILYPFGKHQVSSEHTQYMAFSYFLIRFFMQQIPANSRVPSREKNKGGVFSVSSGSGPPPRDGNKSGVFSVSSGSGPPKQLTTSNRGSASSSVSTKFSASDARLRSPPGSGMLRSKMEQARLTDKNVMLTEEMRRARSATEAHRR